MLPQHRFPAVVAAPFARVRDDRLVLDWDQPLARVSIREHLADDAVDLPRLRRAGRKVFRPRKIQLDERVAIAGQRVAITGKIHDARVIGEHRFGSRSDDGHLRRARARRGLRHRRRFNGDRSHSFTQQRIHQHDDAGRPQRNAAQKGTIGQQHGGRTAAPAFLVHQIEISEDAV